MKHTLIMSLLLYTGTVTAQTPMRLPERVVEIMRTELNYVYDSTSNQRTGSYGIDTIGPDLREHFPMIHNPSPLVVMDGIPTSVEALDNIDITLIDTIQVLSAEDGYTAAIYGTRGAQKGVVVVTTKAR